VKADPSKPGGAVKPAEPEGYDLAEPMLPTPVDAAPEAAVDGAEPPEAPPAAEVQRAAVPAADAPKPAEPRPEAARPAPQAADPEQPPAPSVL
jgi:hypothetical protein